MPRTHYHLVKDNPVERYFWGQIPIERATAYIYYSKGSDYRLIVHKLKYNGRKEIGEIMGRYMATELLESGFFEGIDLLIPVPLHLKKLKSRGFNQSEWIAHGISAITRIPIDSSSVTREIYTETQTHKSIFERRENMENAFRICYPERFRNKHILIVDDVLTTGSTIISCASAFSAVENLRISVLTFGMVH